jgi:hypothetical protein
MVQYGDTHMQAASVSLCSVTSIVKWIYGRWIVFNHPYTSRSRARYEKVRIIERIGVVNSQQHMHVNQKQW